MKGVEILMKKRIKITYENGYSRFTHVNGAVSWPTVTEYFINHWFNVGDFEDEMVKCVAVELV